MFVEPSTAAAIAAALTLGPARAELEPEDTEQIAIALADLPEPDGWATVKSPQQATAYLTVGGVEFVLDAAVTALGDLELSRRVRVRQPS
jgi:hypothetical protein